MMSSIISAKGDDPLSAPLFRQTQVNHINVHVLPTDKYKTNTIVVNLQRPLEKDSVTATALIPQVLRRGTETLPSLKQVKERLDDMYGATFYGNVLKRGERHILQFGLEIANERYLSERAPLLDQGMAFLGEMLTKPAREGNGFVGEYVQSEKRNLRQRIESLIDDKMRYAAERCIQEMCQGEPYSLFNYGRVDQLDTIDREGLYSAFRDMLRVAPIDIFVVGDVEQDDVVNAVDRYFDFKRGDVHPVNVAPIERRVDEVRQVVDRLDVQQGKLNLGLRTQTSVGDDDYVALMVYNGILGGFPHSKLFINVREKASLAYYAASRLESHKGLMTIQSGIEIENFNRALQIIERQLDDMQTGNISDMEMEQTQTMLSNQLREMQDRPQQLIDFHYHGVLSGKRRSLDDFLSQIAGTTKADVEKMAEKVTLDTIYFLRNRQEG